ncbi:cytochrome c oxidase assembly protein [Acuticoccus mangrovi]|uniref:Cytochrome c oxidase assembly protein CtaG n=1 Tax=Acuticoccus mangrovi TaxID=2796142 RepID=A0A934IR38_9HYPH|nr:cytochrome c oxidase assembly protein [Acuticoccus mangrovi]MBJ3776094.1 cytochrome c oxidase assembly protein [Acuticoccus mangrovi]
MASPAAKNGRIVAALVLVLVAMAVLVSYAPTLYRVFCSVTGYGGTPRTLDPKAVTPHAESNERITVTFDANVAPGLDWEFRPETREVEVGFGEPVEAAYYAKNNTDETIVARAAFNVLPYVAAPYFFKIECFCFTEERLGPGESARMPVVFYIDEQYLKDEAAAPNRTVTLSYTFYRQDGLSEAEIAAARDLAAGSKALGERLEETQQAVFDNDAPRR